MVLLREVVVLDQCDKLMDLQVWTPNKIDPPGWLSNFRGRDRELAAHALGRFMFFSDRLVDALFLAAFQNLSNEVCAAASSRAESDRLWNRFLDNVLITPLHGEDPNPADSGYSFARKARQVLGIDEDQLIAPARAIVELSDDPDRPLVFVDDFVGSGQQFSRTWMRRYRRQAMRKSIRSMQRDNPRLRIYYCNAVMTERGLSFISRRYPRVTLSSGNIYPEAYSFVDAASEMWPTDSLSEGVDFLERSSKALGYQDTDGDEDDWRGFHKLGLGLAFDHSTPDATLPLFFHDADGWIPLVRRI